VKRHSDNSIIPKIILILCSLSILSIILLFLRPQENVRTKKKRPKSNEKLFSQVIKASIPSILKLWEEGDRSFPEKGVQCHDEIDHQKEVGLSYYQCNPHFWQCYWQSGTTHFPALEIDLYGQTFHVVARPSFNAIAEYSPSPRFYDLFKRASSDTDLNYGYIVELAVKEIPGLFQRMILTDTCRDTYLPQRIYGYSRSNERQDEGFIWDNFGRDLFIDKFYVTNRQLNEWMILKGESSKVEPDRKKWPLPALISKKEQIEYCSFYGKRLLEAKIFDAAAMSPTEIKNPTPDNINRPDTPWQRDLSKTFLGVARINPDYQLTPLDCELAEVKGCEIKYFSTDSVTWMGFHYPLGFYPESVENFIEPSKNLKLSSHLLDPSSSWHQLGKLSEWKSTERDPLPVAFRCYEEVTL